MRIVSINDQDCSIIFDEFSVNRLGDDSVAGMIIIPNVFVAHPLNFIEFTDKVIIELLTSTGLKYFMLSDFERISITSTGIEYGCNFISEIIDESGDFLQNFDF